MADENNAPNSETPNNGPEGQAPEAQTPPEGQQPNSSADNGGENPNGGKPPEGETGGEGQTTLDAYSDFSMPEGVELDTAALEKAVPVFQELGLNQEQAQKLVDLQASMVQEGLQKQADASTQWIEDLQTQTKNDPELGGDKFDENMGIARQGMEAYGNAEFKELMDSSGLGNHPEVIRFMWKLGQNIKNDVPDAGQVTNEKQDRVSLMYPNANK